MGPRRSHTKSKKGCSQCKLRRIKCNEVGPICSNCKRREIKCDFQEKDPLSATEPTSEHGDASQASFSSCGTTLKSPASTPSFNPFSLPNLESLKRSTELDVDDLELVHHFATVTYKSIIHDQAGEDDTRIWQYHVIKLGFKHEFLLRGILTVSALHLADLNPSESAEYRLRATNHQDQALALAREELANPSIYNCHALFMFSCLVILMTFAGPRQPDNTGLSGNLLDWFYVLRGCNSVMQLHWTDLENSFCYPLLREVKNGETHAAHVADECDRIIDLQRLCHRIEDRETSRAYSLAIHELLNAYTKCWFLRREGRPWIIAAFIWPNVLPQRYLELLGDSTPESMVILAHFAILIHWSEYDWFFRGWARDLVFRIRASLSEEWHDYLKWPEEVVSVPPTVVSGMPTSSALH